MCMGENKGKRKQPVEGERNEASLQHDVTLSAFKSPKQKGAAAAAANMDSRFNLPCKRTSQAAALLGRPVLSTAHAALSHPSTRTHPEATESTYRAEGRGGEASGKEQESSTNLVAIRDRGAARSS